MRSEFDAYVCTRIAEECVAGGIPWQWVHCAICGYPLPEPDHVCEPTVMHLTGITDAMEEWRCEECGLPWPGTNEQCVRCGNRTVV